MPTEQAALQSASREIDFKCPFCQARNKATAWVRIDSEDDDLVTRLLQGTLFDLSCWHCKESAAFDYSVQFVDRGDGVCFWLDPPGDPLALGDIAAKGVTDTYTLRRVTDMNTFGELAHIWDAQLDDAPMLLLKHMVAARVLQDTGASPVLCSFDARVQDETGQWLEYILFATEESDAETVRVPHSMYAEMAAAVAEIKPSVFPAGQWADWNDHSAALLYQAMARTPSETGR